MAGAFQINRTVADWAKRDKNVVSNLSFHSVQNIFKNKFICVIKYAKAVRNCSLSVHISFLCQKIMFSFYNYQVPISPNSKEKFKMHKSLGLRG